MRTFLVTGGAGFIGSNFIRYILAKYKDIKVINLDKLTYSGNSDNLKDIQADSRYKFVKADICDKNTAALIKDVDIIINFAAQTHVDRSLINADEFIRTNILGTNNLLLAAKESKKLKRFLHISTDEVYGTKPDGLSKETDLLLPTNPYSVSKTSADLLALTYFKSFGTPVIIARSSNNFGPYQYPEKLIPISIINILENRKVPVYGDGLYIREWIFVLDNCEGLDFLLNNGRVGQIYNIGGGAKDITNLETIKKICKILKKTDKLIEFIKDRSAHDRRYALDCKKIRQLGFKPKTDFEKALIQTVDWYKNNKNWWEKIRRRKEYRQYYKRQYGTKC